MATLDVSVSASNDDGYSASGGTYNKTDAVVAVGTSGGNTYDSWMRFLNVTVPKSVLVASAYIEVVANGGNNPTSVLTNIYADDSDDAAAPTSQSDHANKARTTAFTAWDTPAAWVTSTAYQSPDIATVIQEVVDRSGWASGNALQVLWDDDGSGASTFVQAASWDHATFAPPKLHIEWSLRDFGWGWIPIGG